MFDLLAEAYCSPWQHAKPYRREPTLIPKEDAEVQDGRPPFT